MSTTNNPPDDAAQDHEQPAFRRFDRPVTDGPYYGADGLDAEVAVVWDRPLRRIDYVREAFVMTRTWWAPPPLPGGSEPPAMRVGYTVHAPPAATGTGPEEPRKRRVFYLRDYDRPLAPDDVYAEMLPCEAVDPMTVEPGVRGVSPGAVNSEDDDRGGDRS